MTCVGGRYSGFSPAQNARHFRSTAASACVRGRYRGPNACKRPCTHLPLVGNERSYPYTTRRSGPFDGRKVEMPCSAWARRVSEVIRLRPLHGLVGVGRGDREWGRGEMARGLQFPCRIFTKAASLPSALRLHARAKGCAESAIGSTSANGRVRRGKRLPNEGGTVRLQIAGNPFGARRRGDVDTCAEAPGRSLDVSHLEGLKARTGTVPTGATPPKRVVHEAQDG